jgi:hypothetical protein
MTKLPTPLCLALLLCVVGNAQAQYTAPAVPTKVEVVRAEGFMISGAFGNAAGCSYSNTLFVRSDHSQYKQIYAAALLAFATKQKISGYAGACEPVSWFSGYSLTHNVVRSSETLAISE